MYNCHRVTGYGELGQNITFRGVGWQAGSQPAELRVVNDQNKRKMRANRAKLQHLRERERPRRNGDDFAILVQV